MSGIQAFGFIILCPKVYVPGTALTQGLCCCSLPFKPPSGIWGSISEGSVRERAVQTAALSPQGDARGSK